MVDFSSRKEAEELAQRLAQASGPAFATLLRDSGVLAERSLDEINTAPSETPQPISIWQPRAAGEGLFFERPRPGPFGDHYATRRRLRPRQPGDPKRIVLLGESAAAGYLLAPHLTPAKVLATQLATIFGSAAPEVIDLARTNERLGTLVATAHQALQLAPDLFIIYIGNNWNLLETPHLSPYFPSVQGRQAYAAALREAGPMGPAELALRVRLEQAWISLAELAAMTAALSIPVVLVIPEVNLADWEVLQPSPWLQGEGLRAWYESAARAEAKLAQGDWDGAASLAQAMIDQDNGLCPTSYRLLAAALAGRGELTGARTAAESAVAASHYATICFLAAPQAGPAEKALQRRAGQAFGFTLVDLPRLFADYTGSPWPGRRLFFDYCHLTEEGVHLAMSGVTAAVPPLLGLGEPLEPIHVARSLPQPIMAPAARATAYFGAAVHTAHRLVSFRHQEEMVQHWCRQALHISPAIVDTMLAFVTARATPCPTVLTFAQQANWQSPYRLEFQHGWLYDNLDALVIEVLLDVLDEMQADVRGSILDALEAGSSADVDLTRPRYLREPLVRFLPEVMEHADITGWGLLRAPWPRSRFAWITPGKADAQLTLTARLPGSPGTMTRSGEADVMVNGSLLTTISLASRWSRYRLRVQSEQLQRGLNLIEVRWPPPSSVTEDIWPIIADQLVAGLDAALHPTFGEICELRVTLG